MAETRHPGRYTPEPRRARMRRALAELQADPNVLRRPEVPECGVRYVRVNGSPTICQRPVPCPDHPIPF